MEAKVIFCDAGADRLIPSYACPIPSSETRATFAGSFHVELTRETPSEKIVELVLREVSKICPDGDLVIFERKVSAVGVDKFILSGKIYRYAEETTASAE